MAQVTAVQPTDMLYVPEITDSFKFTTLPQFTLLLTRPSGEPYRIEYYYDIGADVYNGYAYFGSGGYSIHVNGFAATGDQINDFFVRFDGFGLRTLQFGGDDTVDGSPGNDRLVGLDGDDVVHGYGGDDDLNGNRGNDTVFGDAGRDFVRGGQGDDWVYGGEGDDWHVNGNIGNDRVLGNLGNDSIYGGQGNDVLYGDDFAYGLGGNDYLQGDEGYDLLVGDPGNDTLVGGGGPDTFAFYSGDGNDVILDFDLAVDRIDLERNINGVLYTVGTPFSVLLARISADGLGNSIIDLGAGNSVKVIGVQPQQFQSDDFWFVST